MTAPDRIRRAWPAWRVEGRPSKPAPAAGQAVAVPAVVARGGSGVEGTGQSRRVEVPFVRKGPRP